VKLFPIDRWKQETDLSNKVLPEDSWNMSNLDNMPHVFPGVHIM
jgi:hypothetical protein